MDKSVVSMQDLFKRLNTQGIDFKISNFSKASKRRDTQVFLDIINQLKRKLRQQKGAKKARSYFPIDSTIISLTSKLLWSQGYHQVKLFCGLDSWTSEPGGIVIHFGQGHNYKYGHQTVDAIPENRVGIMDSGATSAIRNRLEEAH